MKTSLILFGVACASALLCATPARSQQSERVAALAGSKLPPDVVFADCDAERIEAGAGASENRTHLIRKVASDDQLDLLIRDRDDLSRRLTLDAEGSFTPPLLDAPVKAVCRGVADIRRELRDRYRAAGYEFRIHLARVGRESSTPGVVTRYEEPRRQTYTTASGFVFADAGLSLLMQAAHDPRSPVRFSFGIDDPTLAYCRMKEVVLTAELDGGDQVRLGADRLADYTGGCGNSPASLVRLRVAVPRPLFARLAAARAARMRFGRREFALEARHLAALREVAQRIAVE